MRTALDKVAFLPFGLLVDQWRWKVFSGEVTPDGYNAAWWELRRKYQGVAAPVAAQRGGLRSGREVPRAGQHARTRAISSRTSCSSSSTARCAARRATRARSTGARSTATRQVGAKLAADAGDGPEPAVARRARGADRRAADGRRPRSSTTSRRSRSGSTSRTRAARSATLVDDRPDRSALAVRASRIRESARRVVRPAIRRGLSSQRLNVSGLTVASTITPSPRSIATTSSDSRPRCSRT